jgi:hypothetical protein
LRILFFMSHPGHTRNFESTLRALAEAGHNVHVAFDRQKGNLPGQADLISALAETYPSLTYSDAPPRAKHSRWTRASSALRTSIDYLRYLRPELRDAHKLRWRIRQRTPSFIRVLAYVPPFRWEVGRRALRRVLGWLDRCVPIRQEVVEFIRAHEPDLVLVTPLLELTSPQLDYFRAAKAIGLRTGLCVASWDNLTTVGLVQETPDVLTVWNPAQAREAVEQHGLPEERIAVTGACAYDHWFSWAPSRSRAEFCELVGLPDERPYILYVCSSAFISPDEAVFIEKWVSRLRGSQGDVLPGTAVVIRPHPTNAPTDRRGRLPRLLADDPLVVVWPQESTNPTTVDTRADYYDSIHHSAAVVGINTSALIESAIVGRAVFTPLVDEYADSQEGTPHFRHLLESNGGLLHVAASLDEHLDQLALHLLERPSVDGRAQAFVEGFVRPFGRDVEGTPKMVAAFEAVVARPAPEPRRAPRGATLARATVATADALARLLGGAFAWPQRLEKSIHARRPRQSSKPHRQPDRARTRSNRPTSVSVLAFRTVLRRALRVAVLRTYAYRRLRHLLLAAVREIEVAAHPDRHAKRSKPPKQKRPAERPRARRTSESLLAQIEATEGPVVAGPWLDDAERELMWWLPFLRWLVDRSPSLSERLVVLSRGDVREWYTGLAATYLDVSDFVALPKTAGRLFVDGESRRSFEQDILENVARAAGGISAAVSPDTMRAVQAELGTQKDGVLPVAARFGSIERSIPASGPVVVRLVDPIQDESARPAIELLADRLRGRRRAVQLNDGDQGSNGASSPLAEMTSTISGASLFVGTWGWPAAVAALFGVPMLAIGEKSGTLDVFRAAGKTGAFPRATIVSPRDLLAITAAFGAGAGAVEVPASVDVVVKA